jgi:hypothetical protein
MESRPPQKPGGTGGSPTPPWIWVFLIAVAGLITYALSGKNETSAAQGAGGLVWLSLVVPTLGFVHLVYLMRRRARDHR